MRRFFTDFLSESVPSWWGDHGDGRRPAVSLRERLPWVGWALCAEGGQEGVERTAPIFERIGGVCMTALRSFLPQKMGAERQILSAQLGELHG